MLGARSSLLLRAKWADFRRRPKTLDIKTFERLIGIILLKINVLRKR